MLFRSPFIALLELIGGIALIIGIFTPVFAALLAADMVGAIVLIRKERRVH